MKISKIIAEKLKPPRLSVRVRLLLCFVTMGVGILSIVETICEYLHPAVDVAIYVIAAGGIFASCYYLFIDFNYGLRFKIRAIVENHDFTNKIYKDYRYRTILFTFGAFLINFFYAISNGIFGIMNHSVWFGTLAAYYLFLSIMRFTAVWYERKLTKSSFDENKKSKELQVYRHCGIILILITVALSGAVILLLHKEGGKSYPGTLIFAAAAYTFYKIIVSVIHIVKARKLKSPLISTIRNIGYADALVSVLSLQTAMFVSFGEGKEVNAQLMNGLTGAGVCMMILFIGIYMIYTSGKQSRKIIYEKEGQ